MAGFARHRRPDTAVVAGTATATANAVNRHAQSKAAEKAQAAAMRPTRPPRHRRKACRHRRRRLSLPAPCPRPQAAIDLVSKLTELAKLRDSGLSVPRGVRTGQSLVLNP